jgi:hypothetical protein
MALSYFEDRIQSASAKYGILLQTLRPAVGEILQAVSNPCQKTSF